MEIVNLLKFDHQVTYDEKDTVGKRYRRQDAIGTPFTELSERHVSVFRRPILEEQ